ncbi:MAG TPA: TylF/MycF/NovP-related O-methyltransferase [Candidatus Binatia bacterium]|nr:TylF/MycF/NovP-related O-methyltransferase [Candidatus Binatia bacterium]
MHSSKLIKQFPLISDQMTQVRLEVILEQLEKVLEQGITGDIVEFGCYKGTTSLFIRRLLNLYLADRHDFHVYDSFAGLPAKSKQDSSPIGYAFEAGKLSASKKQLLHEFHKANLSPPIVHKGWFDQLTTNDIPTQIAFAFLDGDFYSSVKCSLELVWPHLVNGGVVVIDDYLREALPGVTLAVKQFFSGTNYRPQAISNLAVITK